jgi:hypothetical protein
MLEDIPTLSHSQVTLIKLLRERESLRDELFPVFRLNLTEQGEDLSFAQKRLWFLHSSSGENPFYNEPLLLEFTGRLDVAALRFSLSKIRERHATLRTRFESVDGIPAQHIFTADNFPVEEIDLSDLDETTSDQKIKEICQAAASVSLDLSRDSLCRATVLKVSQIKNVVVFFMHHIICDGWSMAVLVHELTHYYAGYHQADCEELPPLPIQYVDYALWEKQILSGKYLAELVTFWKGALFGAPPRISLPRDRDKVAVPSYKGDRIQIQLSCDLTRNVLELNDKQGPDVTLFMTLMAVFYVTLNYLGEDTDLVVGTDIANRPNTESEKLIGFFVNQLVLRTHLDESLSFNQFVKVVQNVCNKAYKYQMYPFDRLIESLNVKRQFGISPLFQVKFVLQNAPVPPLKLSDLVLQQKPFTRGTAKFDLLLDLALRDDNLEGWLEYSKDSFDDTTAQRVHKVYESVLSLIVESPDTSLVQIKKLAKDQERVARQQRRTLRVRTPIKPLHSLIT